MVPVTRPVTPDAAQPRAPWAPPALSMLDEVRAGLARPQKELPSKYFYDKRGSQLFEMITRLPEYYLTRAESSILATRLPDVIDALRPRTLVELGAGSASKTRLILDAMRRTGALEEYVPVDVSAEFLEETTATLRGEYPGLRVVPAVADITVELGLPSYIRRPALFAFLGSTIGNFDDPDAVALLARVRADMGPFDRLLLGADLRKDPDVLERAYNDRAGVTAAFNRNILEVMNRELGANFDPEAYVHRARYSRRHHRIEMHLAADAEQVVHVPGIGDITIAAGETIRTEISCKYDRAAITDMLHRAGFCTDDWLTDSEGRFALAIGVPAP
jgi:L-histidine N-alpha-methyltransferase